MYVKDTYLWANTYCLVWCYYQIGDDKKCIVFLLKKKIENQINFHFYKHILWYCLQLRIHPILFLLYTDLKLIRPDLNSLVLSNFLK